ncbi:MAG: hypothetical protein KAX59_06455, partial [Acidovorax sp.]|nr:hypothetical protein [Acidovorax sp.]
MTKAHPTTGTLKLPPRPPKAVPVAQPVVRPAGAATPTPAKRPNAKPRQRPVTALRTRPTAAHQSADPQPLQKTDTGDRLAKRVATMVPCSRSEAEQYIEGGWVKVNGQIVEEPQFRIQNQTITIDPDASLLELNSITILMHKPADWVDGTEESL